MLGERDLTGGAAWSGLDAEPIHRRLDESACALGIALLEAPLRGVQRPVYNREILTRGRVITAQSAPIGADTFWSPRR